MREIIIDNTDEKKYNNFSRKTLLLQKSMKKILIKKRIEGNLFRKKTQRVLPGLQAVFVDIGNNRNAFLHIKDIVPKVSNETGNKNENFEDIDIKEYVKSRNACYSTSKKRSNNAKRTKSVYTY